ncbi:VCBS repeat-containing protein [thermophilic bacterium 2918]|uniref:VCBS repeat-containing protein n=2 Tax=Thermogemmata fonticola TaxID=2755323 RepID=A0A7V9ACH8_9BACT|nr:VCBS repeat-containing protein [Thermogemmata fonticola]
MCCCGGLLLGLQSGVDLLRGKVCSAEGSQESPARFPRFEMEEFDTRLKIGYAVLTTDINGDGKTDIVVVDQHEVVWYENPTWKKWMILRGKTRPDNVCITAVDIDGDRLPELVLGAGWRPTDTATPGQLFWLRRGPSLAEEWQLYELPCEEPTVHRVRAFDITGDGKPEIVHVPLHGRDNTAQRNWTNGRPVRVVALHIPQQEPTKKENWKVEVLSEELYVTHNFWPAFRDRDQSPFRFPGILVTSYEGVHVIERVGNQWRTRRIGTGYQERPQASRGASEVKSGWIGIPIIATIEPWHGHEVVVYLPPKADQHLWQRHVIDQELRWGHAVWFADLDQDGLEELIVGVRDDPNPQAGDRHTLRRGIRLYRSTDNSGMKWERYMLENGGVAVEDLCAADLNRDGRIDIIAVGRQTGNARIYWNRGR